MRGRYPYTWRDTEDVRGGVYVPAMDLPDVARDAASVEITAHDVPVSGAAKRCELTRLQHHQTGGAGRFVTGCACRVQWTRRRRRRHRPTRC